MTTRKRPINSTHYRVLVACVSCQEAHLRCDQGRPCKRCKGLGKEDECRDVVHRKRGKKSKKNSCQKEKSAVKEIATELDEEQFGSGEAYIREAEPAEVESAPIYQDDEPLLFSFTDALDMTDDESPFFVSFTDEEIQVARTLSSVEEIIKAGLEIKAGIGLHSE